MKKQIYFTLAINFLMALSIPASALPNCRPAPGSQFSQAYNLFGSAVNGTALLKAKSSCDSLNIVTGGFYDLVANRGGLQIFDNRVFFTPHPDAMIQIQVPSQGDYVTSSTCADSMISSNDLRSDLFNLRISENDKGVLIETANESCQLKICPKFGACN